MPPNMLNRFFHPADVYSLLNWYLEFRDELSTPKETMDSWITRVHEKGGTSKFWERVLWDTGMQWVLFGKDRSRTGTR